MSATIEATAPTVAASSGVWARLRRNRAAMAAAVVLLVVMVFGLCAPATEWITGHPVDHSYVATRTDAFGVPKGPGDGFIMGSDSLGRDVFVRIAFGARDVMLVGVLSTLVALAIGVPIGLAAGYLGGTVDLVLSRLVDLFLVFPPLILALSLSASCGGPDGCLGGVLKPGPILSCLVIGLTTWAYAARIVRSQTLLLRELDFVLASRALGARGRSTLAREVLPNVASTVIVLAIVLFPANILYDAALGFLGVGDADLPSWGRMLSDGGSLFPSAWWLLLFPGLFLTLTILAFNLLGEGVRDALDPRE